MERRSLIITLGVAVTAVVLLAAAFASSHPDGLEWVAEKLGFISQAVEDPAFVSPLPDYAVRFIKSPFWSTAIAGLLGAAIVLCVTLLIGSILKKK